MPSDKRSIRFGAVLLQDNYRPPQGSSFFSSLAHWCCATLIHLNILVLRPFFSPALLWLLLFFHFPSLSSSQEKQGAAARAGPLSSACLFVLVLLCSPVQAYISRQLMSRFFHIRAHANISTCWHATAAQTRVKVWSGLWLFCWGCFLDAIACLIARRRRFLAPGACLGYRRL